MKPTADMLHSAIKAAAASGIKVETITPPEPTKEQKKEARAMGTTVEAMNRYYKPSMYINDKQLALVRSLKGGDKVYLCIEGTVTHTSTSEGTDIDGKTVSSASADIEIDAVADITDFKKKVAK